MIQIIPCRTASESSSITIQSMSTNEHLSPNAAWDKPRRVALRGPVADHYRKHVTMAFDSTRIQQLKSAQ